MTTELSIYDGPGFLSPFVRNKTFFMTQSFQCLVYFITKYQVSTTADHLLNYESFKSYMARTMNIRNETPMNVFKSMAEPTNTIINLTTTRDLFLNITIVEMVYLGEESPICTLGGLIIYDKV